MLGGNAAERLVFGDTTTGAENDIEKATNIARQMVKEYGMSERLGPLSFGKRDELVFLGREIGEQRNYSDKVAKTIDEEVRAIIDRGYKRAMDVLVTHGSRLEALAEKLVAEETVEQRRLRGAVQRPAAEGEHPRPGPERPRPGRGGSGGDAGAGPEPDLISTTQRQTDGRAARLARLNSRRLAPGLDGLGSRRHQPTTLPEDPMAVSDDVVEAYLDAHQQARLESYLEFLRIPSVSTEPAHAPDCRRAADWLADRLRAIGMEHVEASETGGHPIVYADWLGASSAPTVVAYGHYDVQPVDPLGEWSSPPFEPAVVGSRVLARGASDDKSNITIFIQAVEALLASRGRLPVNLQIRVRGGGGVVVGPSRAVARREPGAPRRRRRNRQ